MEKRLIPFTALILIWIIGILTMIVFSLPLAMLVFVPLSVIVYIGLRIKLEL
jgi:hypothetical protein